MQKKYFHAFNLIPQFGPQRINKLLNYFNTLESAWNADYNDLIRTGLGHNVVNIFLEQRKKIDPLKEYETLSPDIKIITILDDDYPENLKQISSSPSILYIRGNKSILTKPSIAIVGSRSMSDYGKRACQQLTEQLTNLGLVVISGLATGIDTEAHKACLNVKGQTIAVLGSGIDDNCVYPAQNRKLVYDIINNNGAIISEYPPKVKAQRNFFPARNRIVSGLSLGTLVIEAAQKSGALITAYKALEQNREVFALPGSIYSERSIGCNMLIKKGAKLVQSIDDIIEELPFESQKIISKNNNANLNENEKQLLLSITLEPTLIDKILKSCRLNKSSALSALTTLELKGFIKQDNNHYYLCQNI